MARLDPLIKLRKKTVEDKQRVLAELYRQYEAVQAQKDQLLMDLAREQALIEADITALDARSWFGPYADGVKAKIALCDRHLSRLDTRIIVARDDVRAAFADMKKIEIIDRERDKRDRKLADDKESREMDAIGIDLFRRGEDQ